MLGAVIAGSATGERAVEAIVDQYCGLFGDSHVFCRPEIPASCLGAALERFAVGVRPDEVLVLIDDTLRRSGNSGLVLTARQLFAKYNFEPPKHIALAAIVSVELREKWTAAELVINGVTFQGFSCAKRESIRLFTQMLVQIVAARGSAAAQPSGVAAANPDLGEAAASLQDLKRLL